ncbi:MAG: 2-hydroxy-6-oxo-6-phenylhexa-2,4-dienoate hydrolase [Solirubrobacterales bacterium]|nr:2-hydroxy-6-oxo-6-phenylhexa-2,4-dienoate hydrolase [Solirubrobacterales bacterium]
MSETTAPPIWTELMDVGFRQAFVDAGGIRTRVIEAGDGPALVLLHGTGGHAEAYLRNIRALSARFRVIAYDMVGHGYTDRPDEPYTLDVYSDHLVALLDALGIERAHLSGESLGGWVAAWFAQAHPERVDRLILTTPGNVTSKPETMRRIRESTLLAVTEASPETVRVRLEWLFAPETKHLVSDELVAVRLAIYSQPGYEQAMRNILVLQEPETRARYAWSPDWTGRIAAPTLIIWTSDDPTGTYDEGELLEQWIPGSRLVNIEGAGHWPQWERPEDFHRLHEEFLTP